MSDQKSQDWRCIGHSVRGASHGRNDLPNQDAIAWYPDSTAQIGQGPPLILAVSDGHGSLKNFRSEIGAKIAVQVALKVIRELFLDTSTHAVNLPTIHDIARTKLPQRIVKEWVGEVQQHWQSYAITDDPNWQKVLDQEGAKTQQFLADNPHVAYGATLLTVLVTPTFILYVQLGDGDILCVNASGKVTRPLERDPRLLANETTSLCTDQAWKDMQVRLESYESSPTEQQPALILLSSDGYANSYSSEEEFCQIGRDYLQMVQHQGLAAVAQQLPTFLEETSQGGSGDDITLGIIRRIQRGDRDYMLKEQDNQQQQFTYQQQQFSQFKDRTERRYQGLMQRVRLLGAATGAVAAISLLMIPVNLFLWHKIAMIENKSPKTPPISASPTVSPAQSAAGQTPNLPSPSKSP